MWLFTFLHYKKKDLKKNNIDQKMSNSDPHMTLSLEKRVWPSLTNVQQLNNVGCLIQEAGP